MIRIAKSIEWNGCTKTLQTKIMLIKKWCKVNHSFLVQSQRNHEGRLVDVLYGPVRMYLHKLAIMSQSI